jgi:hypothetical protein
MQVIRPKVTDHHFTVLSRSVHPELFQIHQRRFVERSAYQLRLDITSDGHVLSFQSGPVHIAEVVCSKNQLLPKKRQLLSQAFRQQSLQLSEVRHHVSYQTEFAMERITPKFFWSIHDQLGKTCEPCGLVQLFNSSGRVPLGGLSYLMVEERPKSVLIQSIHTFPDDYRLVKSLTRIKLS